MEDTWKRIFALPYTVMLINTGTFDDFMEDGREFVTFSCKTELFFVSLQVLIIQSTKYDRHPSVESDTY